MRVTLIFANGDELPQDIADGAPPGRLYWADGDVGDYVAPEQLARTAERIFWLDTEVWARESRAEYREVAKRKDER